jgi:GMP synthase-like glutamine amidotransferase
VLDCEDAPKWDGHAIALSRLLGADGEAWEHHRCWAGERPALADVAARRYRALVVTGSHHSASSDEPWILDLLAFLRAVVREGGVRVLGACFGHQLVARALGGEAGPNPSGAFVLRRETIRCEDALLRRADFIAAWERTRSSRAAEKEHHHPLPKKLHVFESHGECVLALPPGATVLARSDTAEVEMFAFGDDVLCWQGHPELPGRTMLAKILPHVQDRVPDADRAAAKSHFRLDTDALVFVAMARAFLRGGTRGDDDDDETRVDDASSSTTSDVAASEGARLEAHFAAACAIYEATPSPGAGHTPSGARSSAPPTSSDDAAAAAAAASSALRLRALAEDAFAKTADAAEGEVRLVADEIGVLAALNGATAGTYAELGEQAAGLVVFADSLRRRDESLAPHLEKLEGIERSVRALEEVAAKLDDHADALEARYERLAKAAAGGAR